MVPQALAGIGVKRHHRGAKERIALAIGAVWAGLALSYTFPAIPPSFGIVAVAVAVYALTFARLVVPRVEGVRA